MVDVVVDRKRHFGVGAVYRAGGSEHEMLDAPMATAFENIHEPDEVAVHVGVGIFLRVADACLGRQVHDNLGLMFFEQARQPLAVHEVHFVKTKPLLSL
jgi:hypothetical protein